MINNNNEMIVKCLDVMVDKFNVDTDTSELTDNDMRWLQCYFEEHCKVEPIDYAESNILDGMNW